MRAGSADRCKRRGGNPTTRKRSRLLSSCWHHRWRFAPGLAASLAFNALTLVVPRALNGAVTALERGHVAAAVRGAWLLLGITAVTVTVRIAARGLIFSGAHEVERDLRREALDRILDPMLRAREELPTGSLLTRMTTDLALIRNMLSIGLTNPLNVVLTFAVVSTLLLLIDPVLGIAILACFIGALVGLHLLARGVYRHRLDALRETDAMATRVLETVEGIMTVRAYDAESAIGTRFAAVCDRALAAQLKAARLAAFGNVLALLGPVFASVVLLAIGGQRVVAGTMTIGHFVEVSAYVGLLAAPTLLSARIGFVWRAGLAALERIEAMTLTMESCEKRRVELSLTRCVDVRALHVERSGAAAIADVSVTIDAGTRVAVVGRTGAGKTTFLQALAGLVPIPPGSVRFDGVDVSAGPPRDVYRLVAYSPQDALLFSTTVRDNLLGGALQPSADELRRAVETSQLPSDLLDALAGPRGSALSGGQRARVSLARALVTERPLLLLDEPFAAVDAATEARIVAGLDRYRGRTMIIATHRLAVADTCDIVLVLDNGRLVEQGTAAELRARGGVYALLHRAQVGRGG